MPGDRSLKCAWIDSDLLGQFPQGGGLDQVSGLDERPQILGPRMHDADAVIANETPVTNQVGGHARGRLIGPSIAITKSWYESPLFTKRRPDLFTAMRPGFERSRMMCGQTDTCPPGISRRSTASRDRGCPICRPARPRTRAPPRRHHRCSSRRERMSAARHRKQLVTQLLVPANAAGREHDSAPRTDGFPAPAECQTAPQ